jgi:biotin-(acetyl-CoA carboxylase) ligase
VSDLTTVAGRGAPAIDRNHLLARLSAELADNARALLPLRIPGVRRRMAAPPRVSRQAGEAPPPDGASVKGTVAGVDSTGALVLADGPRRARFLSGEISLRRV